jgi:hypothetical protein
VPQANDVRNGRASFGREGLVGAVIGGVIGGLAFIVVSLCTWKAWRIRREARRKREMLELKSTTKAKKLGEDSEMNSLEDGGVRKEGDGRRKWWR